MNSDLSDSSTTALRVHVSSKRPGFLQPLRVTAINRVDASFSPFPCQPVICRTIPLVQINSVLGSRLCQGKGAYTPARTTQIPLPRYHLCGHSSFHYYAGDGTYVCVWARCKPTINRPSAVWDSSAGADDNKHGCSMIGRGIQKGVNAHIRNGPKCRVKADARITLSVCSPSTLAVFKR